MPPTAVLGLDLFVKFREGKEVLGAYLVDDPDVARVLVEAHADHGLHNLSWELVQIDVNFDFRVFVVPTVLGNFGDRLGSFLDDHFLCVSFLDELGFSAVDEAVSVESFGIFVIEVLAFVVMGIIVRVGSLLGDTRLECAFLGVGDFGSVDHLGRRSGADVSWSAFHKLGYY